MTSIVELSISCRADLAALARFAVATMASRAEFDVEEIEDLRLAVDELCISVADVDADGQLHFYFEGDQDRIDVECRFVPGDRANTGLDEGARDERSIELSQSVVAALVDRHGLDSRDGQPRAWLQKRRAGRRR